MADITKPDELLLPEPKTKDELDLYRALQDYTKSLNVTFTDLESVESTTAGTGLTDTSSTYSVNVDDTTIEINGSDNLQVKDLGIDTAKLAADAVDGTKIEDDAVNSEHIAAGAIDLEHMSSDSIDSDQYVDGSIDTVHIADNQVTSAKLEDNLVFGTFPLTPSAAPDADYEVANKKYVDDNLSSSALTLTSVTTISSATTLDDITIAADKTYYIQFEFEPATATNTTISLRFDSGGDTINYHTKIVTLGSSTSADAGASSTTMPLGYIAGTGGGGSISGFLWLSTYDAGTLKATFKGSANYIDEGSVLEGVDYWGSISTAATSFDITASQNIVGQVRLYTYQLTV